MNHFETMERYKAYAFTVKDISDLFEIKSVQTLLEATQLKNVTKTLLNVAINPKGYASAMGLDTERNFLSFAQRRMIDFTLGLKLIQIGKQATSFVNSFNQYSYLPEDSKVPRLIQLPVDILGFSFDLAASTFEMARGMFGDKGAIKKMREVSATFDKRIEKALEGEVHSLSSGDLTLQESGQPTSKLAKARRRWRQAKGAQTGIGDILGVMGYYVNYRRNIKNGMSEAAALEAFNDYNETQQSRRNTEKTLLQLSGNPFIRFFTSFSSTLFLQVNKTMQHSTNISRDVRNKKMPAKQDIRGLVINLSIANAFFTAMSNIMLLTSDDDDDRELAWKRIKQSMLGLNVVYAVPILGTSIQGLYEAFGDENKPSPDYGVDPLQPMIRKYLKQYKKDPDDILNTYVKPMIEIAAGANSDPIVGTYNSTVNGLLQSNTSEEEFNKNMSDFFGITPSYQRGYGQTTSDKLEGVIPLGGIKTKAQLKRYDPELYDELYGEADEIKKEINEERKELYKDMGFIEIGGKLYPDED